MTDNVVIFNVGNIAIHFRAWNSKGQAYNLCKEQLSPDTLWASVRTMVTCEECRKRLEK